MASFDYRTRPQPPTPAVRSKTDGATVLLVLNGLTCGSAILILLAIASTGNDPFIRSIVFLLECAYFLGAVPLGIGGIVYSASLRRSEKRQWIWVIAISAILLGFVALRAAPWPD